MVTFIGFDKEPFSQILWEKDGEFQARTVCYSIEDEVRALARFHNSNDFYSRYDKAIVVRNHNNQFEIKKVA